MLVAVPQAGLSSSENATVAKHASGSASALESEVPSLAPRHASELGEEYWPSQEEDPELYSVLEAKAKLRQSREEMAALNATLRAEVQELTTTVNSMLQERDAMKQQLSK
jgi:predicted  nucleic acid-binding Zn-ribbon protein